MRKVILAVVVTAVFGCGGPSKEQYSAAQSEAAKYKKALADETGNVQALQTKVQTLEQQTADLQKKLSEATAAKSELETTTSKLSQQSAELKGNQSIRINEQLLFKENSSTLTADAKRSLDAVAEAIKPLHDKDVIVAGYTDDAEGGKTANVKRWQLSSARALEVAKYLAARGINPNTLAVAGFGPGHPVAPNDTLANRALNRRVEINLRPSNVAMGTVDVAPAQISK